MQDVLSCHRFHLIGQKRLNSEGATIGGHELDFIRCTVSVNEDHRSDITGDEAMRRQNVP